MFTDERLDCCIEFQLAAKMFEQLDAAEKNRAIHHKLDCIFISNLVDWWLTDVKHTEDDSNQKP